MCEVRGSDGLCRLTQAQLGRRLGRRARYVERALRRLEAAGLVCRKGWSVERLPLRGGGYGPVEVYSRRVLGAWYGARENGGRAWVPEATAEWLRGAAAWGGSRRGAGRKPRNQEGAFFNQEGAPPVGQTQYNGAPGNQEGAPDQILLIGKGIFLHKNEGAPPALLAAAPLSPVGCGGSMAGEQPEHPNHHAVWPLRPRQWTKPREECRQRLTLEEVPPDPPRRMRRKLRTFTPYPPEKQAELNARLGYALGGHGDYSEPNRQLIDIRELPFMPGVPPTPASGGIGQLARVPPPPRILEHHGPERRAMLMAQAYRGAAADRTGKPCWALKGRDPRRWKEYAQLLECAQALLDEDIPPAAWAAWSCDRWREMKGKRVAPPVRWCFSAKRVEEHAGWFRSESGGYMGGGIRTGRMHYRLWEKWNGMAQEMIDPDHDPAAVLERWFPGDLYERMHETAQWEAEDYQRRMDEQKARGEWLWR